MRFARIATAASVATFLTTSVASADVVFDHNHIGLEVHDGRIVTGWYSTRGAEQLEDFTPSRVFDAQLDGDATAQWGSNTVAGEFDVDSTVGYNLRGPLHRWDEAVEQFLALDPAQTRIALWDQDDPEDFVFSDDGPVLGMHTPVRTEASHPGQGGRHHTDFMFTLFNPEDDPAAGVYLIEIEVANYGSPYDNLAASSEPLWLVFGHEVSDEALAGAVTHTESHIVPEPGSLALLGLGGLLLMGRGR